MRISLSTLLSTITIIFLIGCANEDKIKDKPLDPPEARIMRHGVRSAIRENMSGYDSCYNELLKRKPNAEGKILLGWDIVEKGAVTNPTIVKSTLKDAKMEKCMLEATQKVAFPAPPKNREMRVGYPFVFTSKVKNKIISQ